jgi:ligand-binding SRPBCC domain-containing protein
MIHFTDRGRGRHELRTETVLPLPLDDVFPFFSAAENLERITPPELGFRILTPRPVEIHSGARIDYTLRLHGIPFRWRTRIDEWDPPHGFVDTQESGPYRTWIHTHTFEAVEGGTRMTDRVEFELPFGLLGRPAMPFVRSRLRRIFDYRSSVVHEWARDRASGR